MLAPSWVLPTNLPSSTLFQLLGPMSRQFYALAYRVADEPILTTYETVVASRIPAYRNHEVIRRPDYRNHPIGIRGLAIHRWKCSLSNSIANRAHVGPQRL